jgi:hypothetical protein
MERPECEPPPRLTMSACRRIRHAPHWLLECPPRTLGDSRAGAFAAGDRHPADARILDQPTDLPRKDIRFSNE